MLQTVAGTEIRRPGMAMRVDPATNEDTPSPLLSTNERVHSSVRVRLACGGLGPDDDDDGGGPWSCPALTHGTNGERLWILERGSGLNATEEVDLRHFQPRELRLDGRRYPESRLHPIKQADSQWRWVFVARPEGEGDERVPQSTVLPEEPLVGYWERLLLALTAGEPDVWKWAQRNYR